MGEFVIGKVINNQSKKWIIFDTWGDQDEYYCVTDFDTQKINELIPKVNVKDSDIEDMKVEWMFLIRRQKNLEGLEQYL